MLVDIYDEPVCKTDIIGVIYKEINQNKSQASKSINMSDEPYLKYVALMYDKNSPLRRLSLTDRKRSAVEHSGFKQQRDAEIAINMSSDRMIMLVSLYLQYQHDFRWAQLITAEDRYWKNTIRINSINEGDDLKDAKIASDLLKINSDILQQIEASRDEIFFDNKEKVELIETFYVEDYVDKLEQAQNDKKK